mmetsp:Transcript_14626/g.22272  ORF Transcript_14626/g.22272 Transcript_14626/m.22272 type:complete len:250 (-) Transcript_14626:89-838(-)
MMNEPNNSIDPLDLFESLVSSSRKSSGNRAKTSNKPRGKPKRPLSAYNLFFQEQREVLLSQSGKLGFERLAKTIAKKWNSLKSPDKVKYEQQAKVEKSRYKVEVKKWSDFRRAQVIAEYSKSPPRHIASAGKTPSPTSSPSSASPDMVEPTDAIAFGDDYNSMGSHSPPHASINTSIDQGFYMAVEDFGSIHPTNENYFPFGSLAVPREMKVFLPDKRSGRVNEQVIKESMDNLISNLDEECIDFLSQI